MVDFGFKNDGLQLTDEEILAEENKTFGSKFMEAGVHSVKITEAGWHIGKETGKTSCKGDATWHNLKIVYENAAGQTYNHYLQVPTSKLTYTVNGKKGPQESPFMFIKFRGFCAGINEVAAPNAALLTKLAKRRFAKPEGLVGETLEITVGYNGPYLKYEGGAGKDALYSILNKDGSVLDAGLYAKSDAIKAAAIKHKKSISELELLSITNRVTAEDPAVTTDAPPAEEW